MGSLADSLFRLMLGWLQGIVAALWSAFTTEKGGSVFTWFGKYWIPLAIVLCVIGLVSDLCVYLVRWKPFRRWFRFLRHDRDEEKEVRIRSAIPKETKPVHVREEETEQPVQPRRRRRMTDHAEHSDEAYNNMHTEYAYNVSETMNTRPQEQSAETTPNSRYIPESKTEKNPAGAERAGSNAVNEPDLSRWQGETDHAELKTAAKPAEPATVTKAGYHVPADSPYRRPEAKKEKEPVVRQPEIKEDTERQNPVTVGRRRRLRITDLFTDPEEELRQLEAPQNVIDSSKAYREPVYPRGWKKSESDGQ